MGSIGQFVERDQLIPVILENRAKLDPHGIWARFPISSQSYQEGFRSATHLELLNAVNKVAWLIEETLGRSNSFETVAYLGLNDLRYVIVVLAAIKTGYKTFLPSPRNSKIAQISLLTRLECKVLLTSDPELPCVPMITGAFPMKKLRIPPLVDLLSANDTPLYPYTARYEDAKDDPIFVLHTSGSTGIPKPLVYTHKFTTGVANVTSLPMKEGFVNLNTNFQTGSFFSVFPSFHIVGIGFQLIIPAFYQCTPVFPLSSAPPTTEGFLEALKYERLDWAFLPPVLIDELSKNLSSLELVASKIKYLYFSGGAVPSVSGNVVSKKLPLHQVIGSSECAMFPLIREERESNSVDWSYIQVHPASNVEFRHRFGDFYELVIVRKPENEHFQPIFTHFPDLQEYETRDLFSPHPIQPGFWKHRSRIDDIIVFLNGEKTNPVSFEHEVSRHPEIKSALVVGNQRVEASLLIELLTEDNVSPEEQGKIIERIWPTVHAANTQCPAYARVSKSRILFADPAVPFLRAPKGTVQRQATIDLYEDKLNKLYLETSLEDSESAFRNLEISEGKSTIDVIRDLIKRVTEWEVLEDGDDLFSLGMDSLQVIQLRRGLISALGISTISTGFIYEHPSVDLLTKAITIAPNEQISIASAHRTRIANIMDTLKRFEDKIDRIPVPKTIRASPKDISPPGEQVVLLTGSTGAVGSFLLDKLVQNTYVSKVYCLNRSENSETVQMARNMERGLSTEIPLSRVEFLTADLTKPNFGLDEKVFSDLAATTTRIIHNAWTVDFNKTLQSFQSNISGLLGLISFSAASDLSPSLLFISSISSVGNYHNTKESLHSIPEIILHDPETPSPMGYGESKYIAERLLDYAEQKLHITAGAARVGQIAGTAENPRGWNRQEWFPSLVLSSKFLGALPETLGFGDNDAEGIDWVPIDQLVDVLIELALGLGNKASDPGMKIFHPIHPAPTSWKSLLPTVREGLTPKDGSQIDVVSFLEWVKRLRGTSELGEDNLSGKKHEEMIHKNPGVKLLDFYEGLLLEDGLSKSLRMETRETLESSSVLRELKPIRKEWLRGWIKGWTE